MKKANHVKKLIPAAVAAGLVLTSGLTAYAEEAEATEPTEDTAQEQPAEEDTDSDDTDSTGGSGDTEEDKQQEAQDATEIEETVATNEDGTEQITNPELKEGEDGTPVYEGNGSVSLTESETITETTGTEPTDAEVPAEYDTTSTDPETNNTINETVENSDEQTSTDVDPSGTSTETKDIVDDTTGEVVGQQTEETTNTVTGTETQTETTETDITGSVTEETSGTATEEQVKDALDENDVELDETQNPDGTSNPTDWSEVVEETDTITVNGKEYTVDPDSKTEGTDDAGNATHSFSASRTDTYDADLTDDELDEILTTAGYTKNEETGEYENEDGETITITRDDSYVKVTTTITVTETDKTEEKQTTGTVTDTTVDISSDAGDDDDDDTNVVAEAMSLVAKDETTGKYVAAEGSNATVELVESGDFAGSISSITQTKANSTDTVTYTFSYTKAGDEEEADETDAATIEALGADAIADMLGDDYVSDGTSVYYVDEEGYKRELTLAETQSALKTQGVSVTVKKVDTEKYTSDDTYYADSEYNEEDSAADAAGDAKATAAEAAAKAALIAARNDLNSESTAEPVQDEDGNWTITVETTETDKDGNEITKTHVLTATSTNGTATTDDTWTATEDELGISKDEDDQYNVYFASGTKTTENASGEVSTEVITWSTNETEITGTITTTSSVTVSVDASGNITVDGATAVEGRDGVYTKTVKNTDGSSTTYTYTVKTADLTSGDEYEAKVAEWKTAAGSDAESITDVSLTKVTVSVTTTTVTLTDVTNSDHKLDDDDGTYSKKEISSSDIIVTQTDDEGTTTTTTGVALDTFDWSTVSAGNTITIGDKDANGNLISYEVKEDATTSADGKTHTITMSAVTGSDKELLTAEDVEEVLGLSKGTLTAVDGKTDTYTYSVTDESTGVRTDYTVEVLNNSGTSVATTTLTLTVTDDAYTKTGGEANVADNTVNADGSELSSKTSVMDDAIAAAAGATLQEDGTYLSTDGYTVTYDADGNISTVTKTDYKDDGTEDGTITYTFTYTPGTGSNMTKAQIEALGNDEIVALLNTNITDTAKQYYTKDGKLYDSDGHELTLSEAQGLVSTSVSVSVVKTDTHDYEQNTEYSINTETVAEQEAKDEAARAALVKAAEQLGDTTKKTTDVTYNNATGEWTLVVKVTENGVEKTHTLTVSSSDSSISQHDTTGSVWTDGSYTYTDANGNVVSGTVNNFSSGTVYTDTATATVTQDVITWTETGKTESYTTTTSKGHTINISSGGDISIEGFVYNATTGAYEKTVDNGNNSTTTYSYKFTTDTVSDDEKATYLAKYGIDATELTSVNLSKYTWTLTTTTTSQKSVTASDYSNSTGTYTDNTTGTDISGSLPSDVDWSELKQGGTVTINGVEYTVDADASSVTQTNGDVKWTVQLTNTQDYTVENASGALTATEIQTELGLTDTEKSTWKATGTSYTYTSTDGGTVTVTVTGNGGTITCKRTVTVEATDVKTDGSGTVSDTTVDVPSSSSNSVVSEAMSHTSGITASTVDGKTVYTSSDGWTVTYKTDGSGNIDTVSKDGVTYTFTYTNTETSNPDPDLTAAKAYELLGGDSNTEGYTLEDGTLYKNGVELTLVDAQNALYKVDVTVSVTKTTTDGTDIKLEDDSKNDVNYKFELQSDGTYTLTYSDETKTVTGLTKNADGSYTYTDSDNVVHTYTEVTVETLTKPEIKALLDTKYGDQNWDINTTNNTASYTVDGVTTTVTYTSLAKSTLKETTVESYSNSSTKESEITEWVEALLKKAESDNVTVTIGDYTLTEENKTDVIDYIKTQHVVDYNAMSTKDLIDYLGELNTGNTFINTYTESDWWGGTTTKTKELSNANHFDVDISVTLKDTDGNVVDSSAEITSATLYLATSASDIVGGTYSNTPGLQSNTHTDASGYEEFEHSGTSNYNGGVKYYKVTGTLTYTDSKGVKHENVSYTAYGHMSSSTSTCTGEGFDLLLDTLTLIDENTAVAQSSKVTTYSVNATITTNLDLDTNTSLVIDQEVTSEDGSDTGSLYNGSIAYTWMDENKSVSAKLYEDYTRNLNSGITIDSSKVKENVATGNGIYGTYDVKFSHTDTNSSTETRSDYKIAEYKGTGNGSWYKYKQLGKNADAEGSATGTKYSGTINYTYTTPKYEVGGTIGYDRSFNANTQLETTAESTVDNGTVDYYGKYKVNYMHTNTNSDTADTEHKVDASWTGNGSDVWYSYKTKQQNNDAVGTDADAGTVYVGGLTYDYTVPNNSIEATWKKVFERTIDATAEKSKEHTVYHYITSKKTTTVLYGTPDDSENGGGDDDVIIPVVPAITPVTPAPANAVPTVTPVTPAPADAVPTAVTPTTPAPADARPGKLPQTGADWFSAFGLTVAGLALSLGSLFSKGKHEKQ